MDTEIIALEWLSSSQMEFSDLGGVKCASPFHLSEMTHCKTVCLATLLQQLYYFPLSVHTENKTKWEKKDKKTQNTKKNPENPWKSLN